MWRLAVLIGMAAVLGCASGAEPERAAPERTELAAVGAALVERNCAPCHATKTVGDSPLAEAPPLRTLAQRYPVSALEEALAEGVLTGHPAMPEFRFQPDEVDAIIAYLQTIQEQQRG